MSNPLKAIGHGIEVAAVDTGKAVVKAVEFGIVDPIQFCVRAERVLSEAIKDEPKVKDAVLGLVKQFDQIGVDVAADVAAKGLNLPADLKTVTDVQALFRYFTSEFLPVVENAYKEISADVES